MTRIKAILIAIDQLVNTLIGGWPDETISARCWRNRQQQPWRALRVMVDWLFKLLGDVDHCREAYRSERIGKQLPPELRVRRMHGRKAIVPASGSAQQRRHSPAVCSSPPLGRTAGCKE